jgi:hypothetical protein
MRWFELSFGDSIHIALRDLRVLRGSLFAPCASPTQPQPPRISYNATLMTPTIHDDVASEEVRRSIRLDPHWFRRMRYAFYQLGRPPGELLEDLPQSLRESLSAKLRFH